MRDLGGESVFNRGFKTEERPKMRNQSVVKTGFKKEDPEEMRDLGGESVFNRGFKTEERPKMRNQSVVKTGIKKEDSEEMPDLGGESVFHMPDALTNTWHAPDDDSSPQSQEPDVITELSLVASDVRHTNTEVKTEIPRHQVQSARVVRNTELRQETRPQSVST